MFTTTAKKKKNDQHNLWIFNNILAIHFEMARLLPMETEVVIVFPSTLVFPKEKEDTLN